MSAHDGVDAEVRQVRISLELSLGEWWAELMKRPDIDTTQQDLARTFLQVPERTPSAEEIVAGQVSFKAAPKDPTVRQKSVSDLLSRESSTAAGFASVDTSDSYYKDAGLPEVVPDGFWTVVTSQSGVWSLGPLGLHNALQVVEPKDTSLMMTDEKGLVSVPMQDGRTQFQLVAKMTLRAPTGQYPCSSTATFCCGAEAPGPEEKVSVEIHLTFPQTGYDAWIGALSDPRFYLSLGAEWMPETMVSVAIDGHSVLSKTRVSPSSEQWLVVSMMLQADVLLLNLEGRHAGNINAFISALVAHLSSQTPPDRLAFWQLFIARVSDPAQPLHQSSEVRAFQQLYGIFFEPELFSESDDAHARRDTFEREFRKRYAALPANEQGELQLQFYRLLADPNSLLHRLMTHDVVLADRQVSGGAIGETVRRLEDFFDAEAKRRQMTSRPLVKGDVQPALVFGNSLAKWRDAIEPRRAVQSAKFGISAGLVIGGLVCGGLIGAGIALLLVVIAWGVLSYRNAQRTEEAARSTGPEFSA